METLKRTNGKSTTRFRNAHIDWICPYSNLVYWHRLVCGIEPHVPSTFIREAENNTRSKCCMTKRCGVDNCVKKCKIPSVCIRSLHESSTFGIENVTMIANSIADSKVLLVSSHTVTVYKDLNIAPDNKFLSKLEHNSKFLPECRTDGNILLYKDTCGTLYTVAQDSVYSQKIRDSAFDTSCLILFDIDENKFVETDAYDLNSSNNRLKRKSRTKKNTVCKRRRSERKIEESINHKRNRSCVCLPRPISLDTEKKRTFDKYDKLVSDGAATPLSGTSYSNDNYRESVIAQASDGGAEGISDTPNVQSGLRRDELSFFQPRIVGFQSGQQNAFSQSRSRRGYSNTAYKNYIDVEARRASFKDKWPHPDNTQSTENMVQGGFFFTGNGDLIRCYQCGIGLKDWGQTDDPLTEHVRYSPDCQYLLDAIPPTKLREIKASFLPNNVVSTRESVRTETTGQTTNIGQGSTTDQTVLHVQPRNPQYAEKSVRISSFSKWPRDITQTPEELAEAGFFYTGCNDIVRCYACDGGLQKWSPEDSAWVEHARWFPHCAYVLLIKGEDFIELVRLSAEHEQLEEEGASEGASGYTTRFTEDVTGVMNHLNIAEKPDDTQSNEYQNDVVSDIKKAVCEATACSEETVKRAVEDMKMKRQQITQDSVANYVLEFNLVEDNSRSDSQSNFQKEPQSVEELINETEKLRSVIKCHHCGDNDANCLFLPCAHHCFCVSCSVDVSICPICNKKIKHKVKTFMS